MTNINDWLQANPVGAQGDDDEEDRPTLESTALNAPDLNPDDVASQRRVAQQAGVSPVLGAEPLTQRAADARRLRDLQTTNPRLAAWMAQPDNYSVARDDAENLSVFERIQQLQLDVASGNIYRRMGPAGDFAAAATGFMNPLGAATYIAQRRMEGDMLGDEQARQGNLDVEYAGLAYRSQQEVRGFEPLTVEDRARLEELATRGGQDDWGGFIIGPTRRLIPQLVGSFQRAGQEGERRFNETWENPMPWTIGFEMGPTGLTSRITPTERITARRVLDGAVAGGAQLIPTGVATFGGLAGGYLSFGYEMETGMAFDQMVRAGIDPEIAAHHAEQYGATATAIEFVSDALNLRISGLTRLATRAALGERMLAQRPAVRAIEGLVGSGLEQGAEEGLQQYAQIIHQDLAAQDQAGGPTRVRWSEVLTPDAIEQILQSAYVGFQGGIGIGAVPGTANYALDMRALRQADTAATHFEEMTRAAQSSRLNERGLASTLESAVGAMNDSNVYIDADKFVEHYQSAGANAYAVAEELGIGEQTLASALASSGVVEIPTSKFAAQVLRVPQHASLSEHARITPTAATPAEIENANEVVKAHVERIAKETEAVVNDNDMGVFVEGKLRELFSAAEQEGGYRPEVARRYAQLAAALPRTMVARARAIDPAYADRLEQQFRTLFGERFDIAGPGRDGGFEGAAQLNQRGVGIDAGPVRSERWDPPEGVRMSDRMREIVEMAVNGASNDWIAAGMDLEPNNVRVTLSQAKAKLGGQTPWERGGQGTPAQPEVSTEQLVAQYNKLANAGYSNRAGPGGDNINTIIARTTGMNPATVASRLSKHRAAMLAAEREAVVEPEPQSAMEMRHEWVDTQVTRNTVPGGSPGDYHYGFALSSGRQMYVGIGDDGNGAAAIDWSFLNRLKNADPEDFAVLYEDGDEKIGASEWRELRIAIRAIFEADMAINERPAYVFTPQRESNRRSNMNMLAEMGDDLGYNLHEDQGSVYLIRPDANIANNGRIQPQEGWAPNFEEPQKYGSQEDADAAQAAFYASIEAADVSADGPSLSEIARATRQERSEAEKSRAKAAQDAGGNERGAGGELNQSRPAFYSAVERAVEANTTARAPGSQWWATISKAQGVKKEELQWLGLEDWLKAQEGPIAREDVLAFVRENGVTVEETVLGEGESPQAELQRQLLPLVEEQDRLFQELSDLSNQIVEGGEGYQAALERRRVVDDRAREIGPTIIDLRRRISDMAGESETKWSSYTLPGGENYRELLLLLPTRLNEGQSSPDYAERMAADASRNFRSSHFDQPNVLAHVRFNERTDAEGKRTLFIEEVQSDWHQKGREQGYALTDAEINAALAEAGMKARHNGTNWIIETVDGQAVPNRLIGQTVAPEYNGKPSTVFAGDLGQAAGMALGRRGMSGALGGVPDAPFKNNAWAYLSMKRMIRWAAENGFEQVAWINGQHALNTVARQLDKSVRRITSGGMRGELHLVRLDNVQAEAVLVSNGMGRAYQNGGGGVLMTREQMLKAFGKDLGGRVFELQDGDTLSGIDFRTGGEGMKKFYDEILRNVANDLGKKYGASVERIQLDRPPTQGKGKVTLDAIAENLNYGGWGHHLTDAQRAEVERIFEDQKVTENVHSLPITQQMREAAMEGQTLFQNEARGSIRYENFRPGDFGSAMIRMGKASDLSTFLHEFGHLGHLVLESMATDEKAPAEFKAMWANTLDWFGVTQEEWASFSNEQKTPYFEQWARTFEAYLMEGKAPSFSLREAFAAFKAWLTQIYRSVFRIDANLNPQIRDVFDRLLATDAEMAQARAAMGSDFALAREAFKTDEEYQTYVEAIAIARDAQDAEIRARVMDKFVRKEKRWWRSERERVRNTAIIEVDSDPARRALEWIAFNEWRALPVEQNEDGVELPADAALAMPEGLPDMRLDMSTLDEADRAGLPEGLAPLATAEDAQAALDAAMTLKRQGRARQPQRLWSFIKAQGGIKDEGGEITQALGSARARPGLINNTSGIDADTLALRAWEAGYFGAVPRQTLNQSDGPDAGPSQPTNWAEMQARVDALAARLADEAAATKASSEGIAGMRADATASQQRMQEAARRAEALLADVRAARVNQTPAPATTEAYIPPPRGETLEQMRERLRRIEENAGITVRTAPDGGPVQAGRDADGAALDLDRLKAEGWDTSRAWARVVPDTAADPWEVRPLGRFGPGLYFGDDVVEGQMTSRVNRIGARQGHSAASHRAYIRDGDMATDAEWREAYRRHSKGPLGERNPRDAEQRAVRELEQRGFIGVVVRDRNDGSMSLNVFRRENILPVPTTSRSGPNAGDARGSFENFQTETIRRRVIDTDRGQVIINPNRTDMLRMTRVPLGQRDKAWMYDTVRYIIDQDGNVYVGPGANMIHDEIASAAEGAGFKVQGYQYGDMYGHGAAVETGSFRRNGEDFVFDSIRNPSRRGTRVELFQELFSGGDETQGRRPTPRELLDALIDDIKNVRQVYSSKDEAAVAAYQNRTDAVRWFEARGVDLSGTKEEIRSQIVDALNAEAERESGGWHPDDIAPWFGFSSGDELIQALKGLKPRAVAIEENIDARLEGQYGDPLKDGTVAEAAALAGHIEAQSKRIEIELEAIQRATGGKRTPVGKAARAYAERSVQMMTVRDLRNHETFLAGERRAARAAMEVAQKGDMQTALLQKQRQLVSFWMYRSARAASEHLDRIQTRWQRYSKSASARNAIGPRHIEQIDAILDSIETGKPQFRAKETLDEWAAGLAAEGNEDLLVFNPEVVAEQIRRPLSQMDYADVQAIDDVLRNIETIGRGMIRLRKEKEAQRISDIQQGLRERIQQEWASKLSRRLSLVAPDAPTKAGLELRHVHAQLLKIDYLARLLDGLKDGGPWMSLMAQAQDAENDLHTRSQGATQQFLAIVRDHYTPQQFREMLSKRIYIDAIEDNRTKAQLISMALNMGNEYNREALLKGERWTPEQLREVLSRLDTNDWKFVQSLWNYVGQWKEESFALDERTRGSRPPEVIATPFTLPDGTTLSGGYWPVAFDSERSDQAAQRDARETVIGEYGGAFRQAATNRGRLKGRVGTGGQALSTDFMGVLAKHVHDSLRDITHRELVITLRRVKADKELRSMIARVAGRDAVRAIDEWTHRLAARMPANAFGDYSRPPAYLRRAGTAHAMGFKVSVATLNLLGHLQAIPRNGVIAQLKQAGLSVAVGFPDLLRRHLQAFATGEKEVSARVALVYEKSEMMLHRRNTFDRDIAEVKGDLVGRREGAVLPKQIEDTLQILNAYTDQVVSVPTWLAAYESARDGKVNGVSGEEASVEYADSVVRMTVSAGATKDLAALMASNNQWQRIFTMFMGWASTFYGQLFAEQFPGVMSGKISLPRFAANMVWIWLLPAVVTTIFYGQHERRDDEDEFGYLMRMIGTGVIYPLQTIPLVRDLLSAIVQGFKPQTPISAVIDRSQKLASAVERGDQRQMVKQGFYLAGQLTGVPAQAYVTGDYLIDWAAGNEQPLDDPGDALQEALLRDTR